MDSIDEFFERKRLYKDLIKIAVIYKPWRAGNSYDWNKLSIGTADVPNNIIATPSRHQNIDDNQVKETAIKLFYPFCYIPSNFNIATEFA